MIDVDTAVDARRWLERAAKQRHHPEQEDGRKEPSEIYASLAKALKFTPPPDSQWRRAAPKKLGGEGWAYCFWEGLLFTGRIYGAIPRKGFFECFWELKGPARRAP